MIAHLEAVHSKPTTRLWCAILKLSDNGVMDVFFLLSQKLRADGIE
jgi:hypothetical protein